MANQHGEFIWYELMTGDLDAAADFYGAVIGWHARAFDETPGGYRLFGIGGADVAGLMTIPGDAEKAGMRPCWLGYVGVDDVDATVVEAETAGGATRVPPTDIPGVGRFALLADPQGALIHVMRGTMEGTSTAFAPTIAGHCRWNELSTSDPAEALAFHGGLFGWKKGDLLPMGEMGGYQLITHHGQTLGGVMRGRPDGPPPAWTFYFGVEDIDKATETARSRGATIHLGPIEVPGGAFIIIASDPQGAIFGLVGARQPSASAS